MTLAKGNESRKKPRENWGKTGCFFFRKSFAGINCRIMKVVQVEVANCCKPSNVPQGRKGIEKIQTTHYALAISLPLTALTHLNSTERSHAFPPSIPGKSKN
jgi:hypothetical protein